MPVNKYHILIFFLLAGVSCIVPYEPEINESQEVLVISGVITDKPGFHYVSVSLSSPYNTPELVPVPGCIVSVEDEAGDQRVYHEQIEGLYEIFLDPDFLGVGKSYSISVLTPSGEEYRSDYDTLLACPPIDTIYYELQSQGTADPELTYHGLQFYNDVVGGEDVARSFRWRLEETWEYTSPYTADAIFDEDGFRAFFGTPIYRCYMKLRVRELYTASTQALEENRINKNALNYVSNQSPRLSNQYSLLVEQQSLTNSAFAYWDKMRTSASEGGGLYDTQPSSTIGNIYNIHKPEEKVLGCFYATQTQEKRINVVNEFDFQVENYKCVLDTVYSLDEYSDLYPYYMISIGMMPPGPPWLHGEQQCFDCRRYGGTTTKPEFWIDEDY
jgi:hypothetical protein